jgi:hypothetical protein
MGGSSCPDCGTAAPAGARLCPACGFPLVLSPSAADDAPAPIDLLRKPGDEGTGQASATGRATERLPAQPLQPGWQARPAGRPGVQSPTVRLPTTRAGAVDGGPAGGWPGSTGPGELGPGGPGGPGGWAGPLACRQCSHTSAPVRVRCERCGAVLPERRPEFPAPEAPRPVRPAARRARWPLVAGGLAIATAAVGTGLYVGLRDEAGAPAPGDQAGVQETAPAVTVPRNTIRASASSTLPSRSGAYSIANTLDQDPGTAWNSDGTRTPTGRGVVLTYRFDRPRHLVRITLSNGYLRSKREADVWRANGRLHTVRLTTQAGSRDVALTDTSTPQTLEADLGTTRVLKITLLSVYPGTKYKDVALTEIAFQALPASTG